MTLIIEGGAANVADRLVEDLVSITATGRYGMVCSHCRKELREEDRFCPGCGARVETEENVVEQEMSAEVADESGGDQDAQETGTAAADQTLDENSVRVQDSVDVQGKSKSSRGVVIGVIAAALVCAVIATVMLWPKDPVQEYLGKFKDNSSSEAMEIYNEKIAGDEELVAALAQTQDAEMDAIYTSYQGEQISYEEAGEQLQRYLDYGPSNEYAQEIQDKIDVLHKDRTAYADAVAAEESGGLKEAIRQYRQISETGENYDIAQERITALAQELKDQYVSEAAEYAANKEYKLAISRINQAISACGTSDDLEQLRAEYTTAQEEKYAKVVLTGKTSHEANYSAWIYSPYIEFTFEITNNSDKAIKGIEGTITFYDLFGKEIKEAGCDFSGHTIAPGETYINEDMNYECNQFRDEDMKLYNTDYSDLQAKYEIKTIVYEDGTSVTPE